MTFSDLWMVLDRAGFETMRALFSVLWQSSILLAAAGLLALALRRRSASVRQTIWAAAVGLAPVLPILAYLATSAAVPQAPIPVMPEYTAPPAFIVSQSPVISVAPLTSAPVVELPPAVPVRAWSPLDYPWALAVLAYAAGAAILMTLVLVGGIRIGRWLRRGRVVTDGGVLAVFESARTLLALEREFTVVESSAVHAPLAIGTLRPAVLLPTGFAAGLSQAELKAVAIHELSHVARRDPPLLAILSCVRAALWFHPLVWLACRQVSTLAEQACDDRVLDATGEPVSYARLLARLAEELPRGALGMELAAGVVFSKGALLKRVEAILSHRRDQMRRLSRAALATTVLAAIVSVAVALAVPLGDKSSTAESQKAAVPAAPDSDLAAWCPLVRGLQAGTTFGQPHYPYRPGETVTYNIYLNNCKDQPVTLVFQEPAAWVPTVYKERGGPVDRDVGGLKADAAPAERKVTLAPGEKVLVGTVQLKLDATPKDKPSGPHIYLEPGQYRVNWTGRLKESGQANGFEISARSRLLMVAGSEEAAGKALRAASPDAAKPSTVGIYLVADPQYADGAEKVPLTDLKLEAKPLLTDKDIVTYYWGDHIIQLTPEAFQALQRMREIWHAQGCRPFVVVADGQRCYLGAFSSDLAGSIPKVPLGCIWTNLPQVPPENAIRIGPISMWDPRRPPEQDTRNDPRLRQALSALGKFPKTVAAEVPWGEAVGSDRNPGAGFDTFRVEAKSFWAWNRTMVFRGDGTYTFEMQTLEQVPGEKHMQPSKKPYVASYRLSPGDLEEFARLVKATEWLSLPASPRPVADDATEYAMTLSRGQETARRTYHEADKVQAYVDLTRFLRRVERQEELLFAVAHREEPFPGSRDLGDELDGVMGGRNRARPYAPALDYQRLVPAYGEFLANPRVSPQLAADAAKLMGYLKLESQRRALENLVLGRAPGDPSVPGEVRKAAVEALGLMGAAQSLDVLKTAGLADGSVSDAVAGALATAPSDKTVPILKDLAGSSQEAAWVLIRQGLAAEPALHEILTQPGDETVPSGRAAYHVIRAYVDHWKELPGPPSASTVSAVQDRIRLTGKGSLSGRYGLDLLRLADVPLLVPNAWQSVEEFLSMMSDRGQTERQSLFLPKHFTGNPPPARFLEDARGGTLKVRAAHVDGTMAWAHVADDRNQANYTLVLGLNSGVLWTIEAAWSLPAEKVQEDLGRFLKAHPKAQAIRAGEDRIEKASSGRGTEDVRQFAKGLLAGIHDKDLATVRRWSAGAVGGWLTPEEAKELSGPAPAGWSAERLETAVKEIHEIYAGNPELIRSLRAVEVRGGWAGVHMEGLGDPAAPRRVLILQRMAEGWRLADVGEAKGALAQDLEVHATGLGRWQAGLVARRATQAKEAARVGGPNGSAAATSPAPPATRLLMSLPARIRRG